MIEAVQIGQPGLHLVHMPALMTADHPGRRQGALRNGSAHRGPAHARKPRQAGLVQQQGPVWQVSEGAVSAHGPLRSNTVNDRIRLPKPQTTPTQATKRAPFGHRGTT